MAKRWLDMLIKAAGEAGEAEAREPTVNPFLGNSGLPVSGPNFVGRKDILQHIEELWRVQGPAPNIVLYGHRRMGKTSILRNLQHHVPANNILVSIDFQEATWVDHTGQFLLELAEAIHSAVTSRNLTCDAPEEGHYPTLGRAKRAIGKLLDQLHPQMENYRLIISMDEFEVVEQAISEGRIDSGIYDWIRANTQKREWLTFILGGLHTLEEMSRDYATAFYGQTKNLKVSYLTEDDAFYLMTQPVPDFSLDVDPPLQKELYRLTFGQPYLLQNICWHLVNNWNRRFLKTRDEIPRLLQLQDLEAVITRDFFNETDYYFHGVYNHANPHEQQAMKLLAQNPEPLSTNALVQSMNLDSQARKDLMEGLLRRDIVQQTEDHVRLAVPLMRQWLNTQTWD